MITEQLGAETTLELKRTFSASRARVFRAWTDPEELKKWFGPVGYESPQAEIDLRVGGRYRIAMRKLPGGDVFHVKGEYEDIAPPERLVFSWQWEGKDMDATDTRVTVEFREAGSGTEVVLTHERFPSGDLRDRHIEGWTSTFECLAEVLA